MAKVKTTRAKRANKANPRVERNLYNVQENVIELNLPQQRKRKKVDLLPRNVVQEEYIEALLDDRKHIVFAIGPAGTGKTMLATEAAIKGLNEGKYDKIVITRPNVAVDDKDIGFLPGDILAKMTPWMMPILDVFAEYYSQKEIVHMIEEKVIEIVPIAYIRGRTFKNSLIIVDEAQGTTTNSMLSILTRIGENSKMVVTGDIKQSDRGPTNGLADFLQRFESSDHIELIKFRQQDIERHPVIEEILKLYGEE
jgi:phosphate starvation-inducible PhoH-like protein